MMSDLDLVVIGSSVQRSVSAERLKLSNLLLQPKVFIFLDCKPEPEAADWVEISIRFSRRDGTEAEEESVALDIILAREDIPEGLVIELADLVTFPKRGLECAISNAFLRTATLSLSYEKGQIKVVIQTSQNGYESSIPWKVASKFLKSTTKR